MRASARLTAPCSVTKSTTRVAICPSSMAGLTDTICPYCGVGCTLSLHVQDGRIVKATSPFGNAITLGNLCVKGRFGWRFVRPEEPVGA